MKKNTDAPACAKTADFFAGIGGIRIGLEDAGFETVFSNDFDPFCKITYDLNFKEAHLTIEDIFRVDENKLPRFDIFAGGFPCQPFSIAGHRKGFKDKGRGDIFFEITRILERIKPQVVFLENVKNLRSHDDGRTYKIIEKTLQKLGYHIKSEVLNTKDYGGIPQNRERIYIVGFRNKKYAERFRFPKPISLKVKVSDLLETEVSEKYYYRLQSALYKELKDVVVSNGVVYQWRRRYVRENKSGVCPTLTANMGMGGHNVPIVKDERGIRKLTPLECLRLQGYPKSYRLPDGIADSRLYKQVGNSVSVPVIRRIAKEIAIAIGK
jgi:DNA (cytosine-5)-methyltransferase 1